MNLYTLPTSKKKALLSTNSTSVQAELEYIVSCICKNGITNFVIKRTIERMEDSL